MDSHTLVAIIVSSFLTGIAVLLCVGCFIKSYREYMNRISDDNYSALSNNSGFIERPNKLTYNSDLDEEIPDLF